MGARHVDIAHLLDENVKLGWLDTKRVSDDVGKEGSQVLSR